MTMFRLNGPEVAEAPKCLHGACRMQQQLYSQTLSYRPLNVREIPKQRHHSFIVEDRKKYVRNLSPCRLIPTK